eukprot:6353544-Karenia_brevis.AAC.1
MVRMQATSQSMIFPMHTFFQVGYHQAYGSTGALSYDQNGYPQGYRHGDSEIAKLLRIVGSQMHSIFFWMKPLHKQEML